MDTPTPDRSAITKLWRGRLQDAKLRLDFARSYLQEVERDFPLSTAQSPDGNFARLQAVRAESLAFRKYNRVLRLFTELVESGKIPDEAEWLREPGDAASGDEP